MIDIGDRRELRGFSRASRDEKERGQQTKQRMADRRAKIFSVPRDSEDR
jgi:hypothetical protein